MKRIVALTMLLCMYYFSFSQVKIEGTVKNKSGEPLVGANVIIEGMYTGTITNESGNFVLRNIKPGEYSLKITYMGYSASFQKVNTDKETRLEVFLEEESILTEEVIIKGIRADEKIPVTASYVDKQDIEKTNLGQDMPYLLASEPSLVVTSDAGNGVGYTAMRIRGSDSRKINVTINGVPLNDAESQGMFWIDIPDISGSTNSIQIQRGVGTSTYGTGAFGASVNINTDNFSQEPYAEAGVSFGSFNTQKYSLSAGTGLINDHWFLEAKTSRITSDGYRDRAWSDLKSYFVQGGFYKENTLFKIIAFGGWEETYQAWYGVDSAAIDMYGRKFNYAGAIYDDEWNIVDYYDNFIDHYQQDHIQLHLAQAVGNNLRFNLSFHYTYGRGYYEEFMQNESLEFYGLQPLLTGYDSVLMTSGTYNYFYHDTIFTTDVVRRLWLDNDFYGGIWSVNYTWNSFDFTLGGAYNVFGNAKHFGEIRWLSVASDGMIGDRFYYNRGAKKEFNSFAKIVYTPVNRLTLYGDIQLRNINYNSKGSDREYRDKMIDLKRDFLFINPKLGFKFRYNAGGYIYSSYAVANREPTRSDMVDAEEGMEPKHETLYDLEAGLEQSGSNYNAGLVLYRMDYRNELVLTGELNNVGTPIRKNVGKSYRMGIELNGGYNIFSNLKLSGNLTLSENKTDYTETTDEGNFTLYRDVDISFSPKVIAGGILTYKPVKGLTGEFIFKHVGKQYLDNTANEGRKLDPYSVFDVLLNYTTGMNNIKEISFNLRINNIFNTMYNSNGSLWGETPYYYPQAGTNLLAGLSITL